MLFVITTVFFVALAMFMWTFFRSAESNAARADALNAVDYGNLTTEWVGCPMVSNDDPWTPTTGWIANYQIGFRSDGVVVWRKKALPPKPVWLTNNLYLTNAFHITNVWAETNGFDKSWTVPSK